MNQIKSKERVAQRGEVFTAEREVNAMLDLVKNECLRPDSRFLEPACGDGNFLSAILRVLACRKRLFSIWDEEYTALCKTESSDDTRQAAKFIISRNIINGNALTLMCVDNEGNDTSVPIVFSEWTLIGSTQMQRSDYTMSSLLYGNSKEGNLFSLADEQQEGGIFLRRYITHYKKVQDYGE